MSLVFAVAPAAFQVVSFVLRKRRTRGLQGKKKAEGWVRKGGGGGGGG